MAIGQECVVRDRREWRRRGRALRGCCRRGFGDWVPIALGALLHSGCAHDAPFRTEIGLPNAQALAPHRHHLIWVTVARSCGSTAAFSMNGQLGCPATRGPTLVRRMRGSTV